MFSQYTSLALVCLMVGCGSEAESPSTTTDSGTAAETTTEDSAPAGDTGVATDTGTADTAPMTTSVALDVSTANYKSSTAAGGGFVHSVVFTINNTSASDVTSLDNAEWDFGGGKTVKLTKPACSGKFAIPAGGKRVVDVQIVVGTSGSLSNFAMICSPSQVFGGASGTAPPEATFSGPIGIKASGTTAAGTFTASGTAMPR
jgi:hypothetical protein